MIALRRFQEDWRDSTSAPLAFTAPGRAQAPESDYAPSLVRRIDPSHGLEASARLGAYRFQYWFRLISLLQKDFPLAGHLMGWESFNPPAAEFLRLHPPGRDLGALGKGFPDWLRAWGTPARVVEAARVDLAWSEAFSAPDLPSPGGADLQAIASGRTEIVLQPSVRILELSRDWFPTKTALERVEEVPRGAPSRLSGRWVVSRTGSILRAERVEPALHRFLLSMRELPWTQALSRSFDRERGVGRRIPEWFSRGTNLGWWGMRPVPAA